MAARFPAISAHRGGGEFAAEGTYAAYESALDTGADYLEFDVRRTADGELVAFHRARAGRSRAVSAVSHAELSRLAGYEVPTTLRILRLLAGRAAAHIDLKQADCATAIMSQALSVLEPAKIIVTTGCQAAAGELRRHYPAVSAGVTVGGDLAETARYLIRRARLEKATRLDKISGTPADWAVVHQRLARRGVLAECRERGLRTMVWTINRDTAFERWIASPEVDIIVTDRPARAVALRCVAQQAHSPNRSQ